MSDDKKEFYEVNCEGCGSIYESWVKASKEQIADGLGVVLKNCPLCLMNPYEKED